MHLLHLQIFAELPEMVCGENDSSLDIKIPVLMISKSAGESLMQPLAFGAPGKLLLCYLLTNLLLSHHMC